MRLPKCHGITELLTVKDGHLHILEYLVERKFDDYENSTCFAAFHGRLDCLKYLHEVAKAPWHSRAIEHTYRYQHCPWSHDLCLSGGNQSECLQYLLDNDCPLPEGWRYERGELFVPREFEKELDSYEDLGCYS